MKEKYTLKKIPNFKIETSQELYAQLARVTCDVANELARSNELKKIDLFLQFEDRGADSDTAEKTKKTIREI